jgi:hypothetical protein
MRPSPNVRSTSSPRIPATASRSDMGGPSFRSLCLCRGLFARGTVRVLIAVASGAAAFLWLLAGAASAAAYSLAVAMSALRRNHASCRARPRRATSPSIPTLSQPVRRMNPHLQPRISLVLRRAHWFCLSHLSECSMVVRFGLSEAPPHAHSLCDRYRNPSALTATANSQTIKTGPSRYKSHSPRRGFLQVAVSEAPLRSASDR